MNLVFLDRSLERPALGLPFLTVQPDGGFSISGGAVATHQLHEQHWVSLAQDTDTGAYYLVFGAGNPDRKPFPLRAQKGKGKGAARAFSAAAPAKKLLADYKAAPGTKSLRLLVGTPIHHQLGALYPLLLEGQALPVAEQPAPADEVPAPAPEVDAIAEQPAPAQQPAASEAQPEAPAKPAGMFSAEMDADLLDASKVTADLSREWNIPTASLYARRSFLKKKNGTAPVATPVPVELATPADATEPAEAPRKTFGLQARAEELTTYWIERDIERTTPSELGEILNLMRHVPRDKRGFQMDVVLERAEKEHTERLKGAGKGGNRG